MPRRSAPDPLAEAIGRRIRQLREERGLTAEKLAYESELGSKGFLSDIERGLARPTVQTLAVIADYLEVALVDLVTFPERDERQALIDRTRSMKPGSIRRLLKDSTPLAMAANPKAAGRPRSAAKSKKAKRAGPARGTKKKRAAKRKP